LLQSSSLSYKYGIEVLFPWSTSAVLNYRSDSPRSESRATDPADELSLDVENFIQTGYTLLFTNG
jgi:hypothetical protein